MSDIHVICLYCLHSCTLHWWYYSHLVYTVVMATQTLRWLTPPLWGSGGSARTIFFVQFKSPEITLDVSNNTTSENTETRKQYK